MQCYIPVHKRARGGRTPSPGRSRPPIERLRYQIRLASHQRLEDLHLHVHLHGWLLPNLQLRLIPSHHHKVRPIFARLQNMLTSARNMGYSANDAQLMSVPPYVCACFFTIAASWYADRVRKRGIFMLGFQLVAIAGFSMLAATAKPRVQYAGTVLAAIGIYPQIPLGMAWNSANIGGSLKRGTGIAMQV